MKIAIQGHPTRGNEIIQILESLGGRNSKNWHGSGNIRDGFFIDNDGTIRFDDLPKGYKLYTLEEFEKEFPFKIGDLCIYHSPLCGEMVLKILGLFLKSDSIVYEVGHKDSTKTHSYIYKEKYLLKPYKEMKEERNITLTLDKAKEWFKKGGELREVALQAFTKEELNPLPISWEEFATNYARMGYYISSDGKPLMCASSGKLSSPHVCPSKKSAEAHLAMIQLEQLRDCWRQGWKPKEHEAVYAIKFANQGLGVYNYVSREFLSFKDRKTATEFLKCFRDLIEKAGDLI